MQTRKLGPYNVSAISLGCMCLSHAYRTPPPPEEAAKVLLRALDLGYTHFDSAALYGFGGLTTIAHQNQCTMGQVSLAWLLAQGDHNPTGTSQGPGVIHMKCPWLVDSISWRARRALYPG